MGNSFSGSLAEVVQVNPAEAVEAEIDFVHTIFAWYRTAGYGLSDQPFADAYLPTQQADVAVGVRFAHQVSRRVFDQCQVFRKFPRAAAVMLRRGVQSQCFMRPFVVVAVPPAVKCLLCLLRGLLAISLAEVFLVKIF